MRARGRKAVLDKIVQYASFVTMARPKEFERDAALGNVVVEQLRAKSSEAVTVLFRHI